MNDTVESSCQGQWLVLTHQLPPEPAYFRVRVRRRLAGIGALPLKNSVYVLPAREDTREDLEWLLREIVRDGGEASLSVATFIDGWTDARLRAAFDAERNAAYAELAAEARRLREVVAGWAAAKAPPDATEAQVRLTRTFEEIRALDFFNAPGREEAEEALALLEFELKTTPAEEGPMEGESWFHERPRSATWVTRRGVKVDRTASAWLIRRFIDPEARFRFVDPAGYRREEEGELRFDMFDGEYTHEGERCTFETLLRRFSLEADPGLAAIAEIVHDLDLKEKRYDRVEAAGVTSILAGIARGHEDDGERIELGASLFDALYEHFREAAAETVGEAVSGSTPRLP